MIPDGTLQGAFVKMGGELDLHGVDENGNPVGGLVFGNMFGVDMHYHE